MWLSSRSGPFQHYHQRLLSALSDAPERDPLSARNTVRAEMSAILGLSRIPLPEIRIRESRKTEWSEGLVLHTLIAESWEGCVSTALYVEPADVSREQVLPAIHLVCGHGKGGRLAPAYLSQAMNLARAGARVLIHDNLGQGEREPMGHRDVRLPYAHGFCLQGMIYREAEAWQNWLGGQPGVDRSRIGMVGNSGGGLLTLLFACFSDHLAAISSSGYPSSFAFIAAKEKDHCSCNLLPGVVGRLEMWQLYSLFAPRPLFLFQGAGDPLFPEDLFYANLIRVKESYTRLGAGEALNSSVFAGAHSWEPERVAANTRFFARIFAMQVSDAPPIWLNADEAASVPRAFPKWPDGAVTTEQLAARFAGVELPETIPPLWEIVSPELAQEEPAQPWGRGEQGRILAQFEIFLRR